MPDAYNTSSYISTDIPAMPPIPGIAEIALEVGTGPQFGAPQPKTFSVSEVQWVRTNVAAFSWNNLILDGQKVPAQSLRNSNRFLAFQVQPGSHVLEAAFEPDPLWVKLRSWSVPATAFLSLGPLGALLIL